MPPATPTLTETDPPVDAGNPDIVRSAANDGQQPLQNLLYRESSNMHPALDIQEILSMILTHALPPSPDELTIVTGRPPTSYWAWNLRQVCKTWRRAALKLPCWNSVAVGTGIACSGNQQLGHDKLVLAKKVDISRRMIPDEGPIRVGLTVNGFTPEYTQLMKEALNALVIPYSPRLIYLKLAGPLCVITPFFNLPPTTLAKIETLDLDCQDGISEAERLRPGPERYSRFPVFDLANNLNSLVVKGGRGLLLSLLAQQIPWAQLTKLKLSLEPDFDLPVPWRPFLESFSKCDNLRSLTINIRQGSKFETDNTGSEPATRVLLPRLTDLQVLGWEENLVMKSLQVPKLSALTIGDSLLDYDGLISMLNSSCATLRVFREVVDEQDLRRRPDRSEHKENLLSRLPSLKELYICTLLGSDTIHSISQGALLPDLQVLHIYTRTSPIALTDALSPRFTPSQSNVAKLRQLHIYSHSRHGAEDDFRVHRARSQEVRVQYGVDLEYVVVRISFDDDDDDSGIFINDAGPYSAMINSSFS